MGCHIHLHVEQRAGDQWEYVERPSDFDGLHRNYREFAVLANVRNWKRNEAGRADYNSQLLKPIAMPRGLPGDATEGALAAAATWEGDGHSYTWLTLRELYEADWSEYHSDDWYKDDPYIMRWAKAHWPNATDDVRLVFWFDN